MAKEERRSEIKGSHPRTTWVVRKVLSIILAAVCMLGFVACSDDNGVATLSGPVPVYLHVSADLLGDLNATRAAGNDPYAEEGEFMNTLCVFVVNSNDVIEAKFGPDILEAYSDAATGDLTDWTSERIELTAGEKTIYAFSNWNNMGSDAWDALIAKEVGESITSTDLNFTVDDPASKVDPANGKYIPMSGKATAYVNLDVDLNYNPQLIDVGMDRLVGKVTIAINGESGDDAQEVLLGDLSFEGWADKVPLMSDDASTYTYTYTGRYDVKLERQIAVDASGVSLASFYVNETYRPTTGGNSDGYTITLDTDRYGGTDYTATTTRTAIPRNNIYPILLTLDQNVLDLQVTAWTDPLGIEEVPYYNITVDDNTYFITLLDVTSTFQIAPSMIYKGTKVSTASWTWTYVDVNVDKPTWTVDSNGAITVTQLTATPGYEYGFTLLAEWTVGTTTHTRTYNFFVGFVEGWPSFTQVSRAWWSQSYGSETVPLRVKQ